MSAHICAPGEKGEGKNPQNEMTDQEDVGGKNRIFPSFGVGKGRESGFRREEGERNGRRGE